MEKTDFKVNMDVLFTLVKQGRFEDLEEIMKLPSRDGQTYVEWANGANWLKFDVCNDWKVAGQLMEDSNIHLLDHGDGWQASHDNFRTNSKNKNPKRAIAECFLMMNEAGLNE